MEQQNVVFFDGLCGLCSEFIDFVMKIDKRAQFKFSPLQSSFALKHLPPALPTDLSTVVIIIEGKTYTKALAVLHLFHQVGGPWKGLAVLRFLPQFILNLAYDIIAKNRYRLMPKKETCRLPTPAERERFIL